MTMNTQQHNKFKGYALIYPTELDEDINTVLRENDSTTNVVVERQNLEKDPDNDGWTTIVKHNKKNIVEENTAPALAKRGEGREGREGIGCCKYENYGNLKKDEKDEEIDKLFNIISILLHHNR